MSNLAAFKRFVLMGPDAQGVSEALHLAVHTIADEDSAGCSIGKRQGDAR
jgi:hypothetical protein